VRTIINSFRQIQKNEDVQEVMEQLFLSCFFGIAVLASVGHLV